MDNNIKEENIRGFNIKFKTKPGVFAKHGLDDGSRLLLKNLKVDNNTLIADLGCGTGIVGFVCAKLNPEGHIHLLDDHLRSVNLAKESLELNNLNNVEIYLSDLFSAVLDRTYHLIVSNPPQQMGNEFLEEVIKESYNHLKSKGKLVLVIKNNFKKVIERILEQYFSKYEVLATSREHLVVEAIKTDKLIVPSE